MMKCPVDGAELAMAERSGVEIDYCPKCRGVWLDRGELDKIIDRNGQSAPSQGDVHDRPVGAPPVKPYKKRKRNSFLGELFDF